MVRKITYTRPSVQIVPDGTPLGSVMITIENADPADGEKFVNTEYRPVELAWLSTVVRLTEKQKNELITASGVKEAIGLIEFKPFVFTTDTEITIAPSSKVAIAGTGNIKIWDSPTIGQEFLIADPLRRLQTQSNKVIAPVGQTIGSGQFVDGVAATNEFDLSTIGSLFAGGGVRFILDESGSNWLIDLAIAGSGASGSTVSEPDFVFTTAAGITIANGGKVFIREPGSIQVWNGAIAGQSFSVIDPYQRLQTQSNVVIAPVGQTIAAGQLNDGVTATNEFDLSSVGANFAGGAIEFVLDWTGVNWAIALPLCVGGSSPAASTTISFLGFDPNPVTTIDNEIIVQARFN